MASASTKSSKSATRHDGLKATLLPAARRFGKQALSAGARDRSRRPHAGCPRGRRELLSRHFRLRRTTGRSPRSRARPMPAMPPAPHDARRPCHVLPDINGARLLAHGEALALSHEDVAALLPALRPLFGDADSPSMRQRRRVGTCGCPGNEAAPHSPNPTMRWAPMSTTCRATVPWCRWRTLLSEAQVLLHNHPWNARRGAGQARDQFAVVLGWRGAARPCRVDACAVQRGRRDRHPLAHAAKILSPPRRGSTREGDAVFDPSHRDLAPPNATGCCRHWPHCAMAGCRRSTSTARWRPDRLATRAALAVLASPGGVSPHEPRASDPAPRTTGSRRGLSEDAATAAARRCGARHR